LTQRALLKLVKTVKTAMIVKTVETVETGIPFLIIETWSGKTRIPV